MPKKFKLPDTIIRLVDAAGGCIASDKVTVEGLPVGYMYRDMPARPQDSGWRFLSGLEDEAYMADTSLHEVFDVNTIANHDPAIIPYLSAPVGSQFKRSKTSNSFIQVTEP